MDLTVRVKACRSAPEVEYTEFEFNVVGSGNYEWGRARSSLFRVKFSGIGRGGAGAGFWVWVFGVRIER